MDYYKLKVLNYKKEFFIVFALLIVIGVLVYFFYFKKSDIEIFSDNENNFAETNNILKEEDNRIYVDIKGYVSKPGVYSFKISDNARINDLILKAGGLKKDADTSTINLSKKLEDEMAVIVYSKKEINDYTKTLSDMQKKLELCEINLKNNACLKEEKKEDEKINLNTASIDELKTLTGIGEEKAKAIIEYRKKKKFETIEDLKEISGIGESMFEKIKNNLTV